eukprot:6445019-Pyramimonas_sp.AAC.1
MIYPTSGRRGHPPTVTPSRLRPKRSPRAPCSHAVDLPAVHQQGHGQGERGDWGARSSARCRSRLHRGTCRLVL